MSTVKTFGQRVCELIREAVPAQEIKYLGAETQLAHPGAPEGVVWQYRCPCGEISGLQRIMPDMSRTTYNFEAAARYEAERMLEMMRHHVRGEGNEPSF